MNKSYEDHWSKLILKSKIIINIVMIFADNNLLLSSMSS